MTRYAYVAVLIAAALLLTGPRVAVRADDEEAPVHYDAPSHFALPWACGEAVRVTWRPEDHWEHGNTRGVAFDFSMTEGTPLYAPVTGTAHFRRDARDIPPHLGNYVEIATEDGWLLRLAHLLDEQSGEREVRVGEFIGYSGSSGASAPHLHLEILVRVGGRWVAPDLERMDRLFGLPTADIVVDAVILNDRCTATFALDGGPVLDAEFLGGTVPFGQLVRLAIPLRNEGLEPAIVDRVDITMRGPGGQPHAAAADGLWQFEGKDEGVVAVDVRAVEPGTWRLSGVSVSTAAGIQRLPAEGSFEVGPPPIALVGLAVAPRYELGDALRMDVWLENPSPEAIMLEDLHVSGVTHRGEGWKASVGHPVSLPAGVVRQVTLRAVAAPHTSGQWTAQEVAYPHAGERYVLKRVHQSFVVDGPELVVDEVYTLATPRGGQMALLVANAGTRVAAPERITLWGATRDGDGRSLDLDGELLGVLAPGQARLLHVPPDVASPKTADELLDIGYWSDGHYHPIKLLYEVPVSVGQPGEQPVDAF